ncbi:MAG: sensor histidine kinase, partial [Kurthia sp.]
MLLLFLKERRAWLLFFILIQALFNIYAYIDTGFAKETIRYINALNIILFTLFMIWRYFAEMSSYKRLLHDERVHLRPLDLKSAQHIEEIESHLNDELNRYKIHAAEEQDRMLAWIHDIKTPLTAQKLLIDSLPKSDPLKNRLELEWARTYQLIDQELYSIRLDTIQKDNRIEIVDLQDIVRNELSNLRNWCLNKGIGIDVELEDLTHVLSDRKWAEFILRQVITNAVKYSEENSEIAIRQELLSDGHIQILVEDTGEGILAEDLPRIFEKSYTGTIGRKKSASTGMGLYLAKQAADQLGIKIFVESKIDEGSSFTIRFPLENEYYQIISNESS